MNLVGRGSPTCDECGSPHFPELPHNPATPRYRMRFFARHGRHPNWDDAMAHCTPGVRAKAREILRAFFDEDRRRGAARTPEPEEGSDRRRSFVVVEGVR